MKCKYKHCNINNSIVDKKDAIKIRKNYYHKKCYREKRIKARMLYYIIKHYKLPDAKSFILKRINEHCKEFDSKFILFVLTKKVKLNFIDGLKFYLRDNKFMLAYNRTLANKMNRKKVVVKTLEVPIFDLRYENNEMWGEKIWKCHSIPIVKQE
jgi:hypothetical protein